MVCDLLIYYAVYTLTYATITFAIYHQFIK